MGHVSKGTAQMLAWPSGIAPLILLLCCNQQQPTEWRDLPCTQGKAGAGETQHLAMMVHVTVVTPASWDSLSEDSPLGTEACHSSPPSLTWGLFTRLHLNTWMLDVRLLPSALSP